MPRERWVRRPEGEGRHAQILGHELNRYDEPGAADREWMEDGNCVNLDPWSADAIFYPNSGEFRNDLIHIYCDDCPVRERCFEYGRKYGLGIGRWGGRAISNRTDPRIRVRRARSAARRRRLMEEDALPVPRGGQEAVGPGQ